MAETGLDLPGWLRRAQEPISGHESIAREGNSDGPLAGEVVAFTGALSLPRHEAAALAADAGCDVGSGVTHRTTLLVVGDQDTRRLAGHEKSLKHRKAEELISEGFHIRIVGESDFRRLVGPPPITGEAARPEGTCGSRSADVRRSGGPLPSAPGESPNLDESSD